jgi:hypothetical protein
MSSSPQAEVGQARVRSRWDGSSWKRR